MSLGHQTADCSLLTVHLAARPRGATSTSQIHFDISQIRVIKFNLADPDSVEEARGKLQEQVQAVERGEPIPTPVHTAQLWTSLRGGEERDRQILEALQGISGLKKEIPLYRVMNTIPIEVR
jgi:hypothetical protein